MPSRGSTTAEPRRTDSAGERARARSRIIDTNHAQDDDCSYDIRFRHGHVQLRVPCENCRKKDWVGVLKENDGVSRSLMAANPLTEKNDASVKWYEKLLMWEQGKLEEAPSPTLKRVVIRLLCWRPWLAEDQDVSDEAPRLDNAGVEARRVW